MTKNLLTKDELEALKLSAELANLLHKIIHKPYMESALMHPDRERSPELRDIAANDWNEAAQRIHGIQHTIMSQAAARAYPEMFRLLGSRL